MKAVDFAFWLQGHFEIKGDNAPLTRQQADVVLKKAQTVVAGPGAAEAQAQVFVSFAQGALLMATQSPVLDNGALTFATDTLRNKLNDLLVHAIDPTIKGDQEQLRRTHRPDRRNDSGFEAMC